MGNSINHDHRYTRNYANNANTHVYTVSQKLVKQFKNSFIFDKVTAMNWWSSFFREVVEGDKVCIYTYTRTTTQ